jgi:tetratricopeptide (TPR) repeat protein
MAMVGAPTYHAATLNRSTRQGVNPMTTISHQHLVCSQLRLGQMCFNTGAYKESERAYKHALVALEAAQCKDELLSACLLNLATVLGAQDKHEEAEQIYRRLLSMDEFLLGSTSTEYAMDLNNVAVHYCATERYTEAEALYMQAMSTFENRANGDKDPDYALLLNNLALLYYDQDLCEQAEPLLRKSLELREAVLGPRHQYTAESMTNLAELLVRTNRFEEADELFQRGIAILQFILGPNHPELEAAKLNYEEARREFGRNMEPNAIR